MAEKKERFEILLEEIRDDVKAVGEGHAVIRREMQEMKSELKADIKEVDDKLKFVASKVNKIDQKLDEYMRQPAHA